ncbi:MAG: PTS lactose/cellobiose transporter subunit IIA [Longicatena sp.]
MIETYETAFGLILNAGNSKSKSLMAIEEARDYNFEEAKKLVKEAEADLHIAHQMQTTMIQSEAKGDKSDVNIMMVHAQDHLTTAMIMIDQANEFIHIYQILESLIKEKK